jgi:16S rRNA (cytidine1402-2'-O)-methyltransferase
MTDLESVFGAARRAAVCRELTKIHEEVQRGTLAELRSLFQEVEPRGEFTLVVAGAEAGERWSEAQVRAALRERDRLGDPPSRAARQVAERSGWTRSEVYRLKLDERNASSQATRGPSQATTKRGGGAG